MGFKRMKNILRLFVFCLLGMVSVAFSQQDTESTTAMADSKAADQLSSMVILAENVDYYRKKIADQKKGVYVQDFYKTHEKRTDPYLILDISKASSANFDLEHYNTLSIHGAFVLWYKNGKMASKGLYDQGVAKGAWRFWYEQGQKKMAGYYRSAKKEGQWTVWYENGRRMQKGLYHNGKREGVWIFWYQSGKKKEAGRYSEGKPIEGWNCWDEYGHVTRKEEQLAED